MTVKQKSGLGSKRSGTGTGAVVLTVATIALGCSGLTFAQNEDKVKAGLDLWKGSGCSDCHGAFANGERERDESPAGADLRSTRLDAAALKKTISCGRTGAEMPAFMEGAGSAPACAQGVGEYPAPRTLTSDQIDTIVAYLQARIVGHRQITKSECMAYYDNNADQCEDYK